LLPERVPERWPFRQRIGSRIDRFRTDLFVLRPGWNQTPTKRFHDVSALLVDDYQRTLRWSDVELVFALIDFADDVQLELVEGLASLAAHGYGTEGGVAAAHGRSMRRALHTKT
jgi:hypothetical protein